MTLNIVELLHRGLDAAALRQRTIANNVANANTPGFKRSFVTFEEHVRDAIDRRSFSPGAMTARLQQDRGTSMREDGNNVSVEHEMVLMAANTVQYQALSQQLSERLSLLRYVINEGRR
ncbi:MAG: flagellar basal body rod protein FlgB [Peptococcaceae bacterium]|nr:flagellar basal body rod protein FlgB [Peptococcaceae bacterium]